MHIAAHITFFFVEDRISYLKEVVHNLQMLPHDKTIFIYSNGKVNKFIQDENIIFLNYNYKKRAFFMLEGLHNEYLKKIGLVSLVHPFYLAWESRTHVLKNIENFDVQLYLEDDIGFDVNSLNYWLEHKDICLKHGYNLGFLRIETTGNGEAFITDLTGYPGRILKLDGKPYLINDVNPYCGFWIYDKKELRTFVKSNEWKFRFDYYGIREKAAIGWHGINMSRYKGTIIPIIKNDSGHYETDARCAVRHLANNYIGRYAFCKIKFPINLNEIE
ncbi:hypothetical protein ACFSRY_17385 [Pontibacter locisalis]|uniref:Uncharacterized protein n=1 Tax=Pontibacter locisalis TaxID=1719035 RepID=A0ABW5IPR3_9BACT